MLPSVPPWDSDSKLRLREEECCGERPLGREEFLVLAQARAVMRWERQPQPGRSLWASPAVGFVPRAVVSQ